MNIIGFRSSFISQTGWESSHFGGHERLIWDFPHVSIPDSINVVPGIAPKELSWFSSDKLLKIFLVLANEHNLIDSIFSGGTAEIVNVAQRFHWTKEKKIKISATTEQLEFVHEHLCHKEEELAPLLDEFKEFILSSGYNVMMDLPSKEGKEGDTDSESSSENKDDPSGNKNKGRDSKDSKDNNDEKGKSPSKKQTQKLSKEMIKLFMESVRKELMKARRGHQQFFNNGPVKSFSTNFDKKPNFISIEKNRHSATLSSQQTKSSEQLIKMLDINWEADKDVVKSLRTGKIDVSKIAEVPAGNVSIYQREMEEQITRPFSICILMDESGSMGSYHDNHDETVRSVSRYTEVYRLIKTLYGAFSQIMPEDKIFIYGHTGDSSPTIYVYHDTYNPNFLYTVDDMQCRETMQNYDGPVIGAIHKKVRTMTDDRIIFLILSDGEPSGHGYGSDKDIDDLKRIVERARRDDFITVGVGIQYTDVELYTYNTVVNDLNEMPRKVSHLLNKVVKTEFQ